MCVRTVLAAVGAGALLFASGLAPSPPFARAGPAAPPGTYVALGDSFAAGPLTGTHTPEYPGCLQSDHNYPHLVAGTLALPFRDATCIAATTGAMTAAQDVNPPPPNPPQFDRLDAATTTVTVTIGGNDIGYTEVLLSCFTGDPSGTPCQDRYVVDGVDEISNRIAATAPNVAATVQGIRDRAPAATIYLVGYLSVLPATGVGCFPTVPLADGDVPYLLAKEQELNTMLATQAAATGAVYVDAGARSVGHDACAPPGVRWVEPAIGWSMGAPMHPNTLGEECYAVMVLDQLAPGAAAGTALCRAPAPEPVAASPRFTG
ncbi:MAG TPA: SGNH/GDSL hydrolase family protein [Acidimicrobiia bacterium]